ncbi:MAG: tRNA glutamyl-Q(34) synthetase GluQRS [Vicinamibacteria bacterium]
MRALLPAGPPPSGFTTRFAPSPTGFLHLGHVASAIAVWGVARAFSGRVLLRIEDHDRTRSRPEFERAILQDLEWLGLRPDEPLSRQSERVQKYEAALDRLSKRGLVYACGCSRKTIEAAAARALEGERRYPGTCRDAAVDGLREKARRVRLSRDVITFRDLRLGLVEQIPADQAGDTLARDRHGHWTYQFAVAVDDLEQGVDLVIRGEDLLTSTGRQIQLTRLLGREKPSLFLHHPLITHPDGAKLSKSNRDTGIRDLRAAGWSAERVLGRAAASLGLGKGGPAKMEDLIAQLTTNA